MDDWYNDSLAQYPRVLIQREQTNPTSPSSQRDNLPTSRGGGNLIRIRVQGRRSGSAELETPKVTVHRYSQGQGSSESNVTVQTVRSGTNNLATVMPIKHITSSPVSSMAYAQRHPGSTTRSRQPMRAVPLTSLQYDCDGNPPVDKVDGFSSNPSPLTRRSTGLLQSSNRLLDSFEKEFDKFTTQYTSIGKNPYSRSKSEKTDDSRSYASRRHDSEDVLAARRRNNSMNMSDDGDQVFRRSVRAASPNVFLSTYSSNNTKSATPGTSPTSPTGSMSGKRDAKPEEGFHPKKDDLKPASIAKAKWVLDKVLRDLVSKDEVKGRRRSSIITEAQHTIKRFSDDLDINQMSRGDDNDSGYSGSGDTTKSGFTFSTLEIKEKIRKYNDTNHGNKLTEVAGQKETFQGDIQICMCLEHPVSMLLNTKPTSLLQSLYQSKEEEEEERITALATIPENTITKLHITSEDNTEVVIQQLLNKFNIVGSPKTYALYEQTMNTTNEKEVKLRKAVHSEKPLLNFLRWSTETHEQKRFLLKESYNAEIMWDSFSIPELSNFVKMLEIEYKNQVDIIRNKYRTYKGNLQSRMAELRPGVVT